MYLFHRLQKNVVHCMMAKYVITNERLLEFVEKYLNSLADRGYWEQDPFIIISGFMEDDDETDVYFMEWDRTDGRLYINKRFLKIFTDMFPFSFDQAIQFISDWFEKRFEVKVAFVDT